MQIVGYMILLVFYLCYFIKMFQQRKQGIQTDHMGKGKQGIQKKIEIMMKGATIATFIIEILSIYLNTTTFPLIIRIMGIFLGIIGDIVFIASVLTMKDSWRAGVSYEEKTDLITNGIYQISRNPAFLGFDLVYLGMCFASSEVILPEEVSNKPLFQYFLPSHSSPIPRYTSMSMMPSPLTSTRSSKGTSCALRLPT